jgi:hypothetical protein
MPAPPMPMAPNPEREKGRKINTAFFATVAFFALSHPIAYRVMNQIFMAFSGQVHEIITESGAPTIKGHFLHSVIFFVVILFLLMKK